MTAVYICASPLCFYKVGRNKFTFYVHEKLSTLLNVSCFP